jgi:hypothetical protein
MRGKVDAERDHPLTEPCDGDHPRVLGPDAKRHATGEGMAPGLRNYIGGEIVAELSQLA